MSRDENGDYESLNITYEGNMNNYKTGDEVVNTTKEIDKMKRSRN